MMRWMIVVLLMLAAHAHAAGAPFVRATIETRPPLLVGQQVRIDIDVFVPNFFMSSAELPTIDIPGAVVTPDDGASNLVETIDGQTYAGVRHVYVIVPQREGEFVLPPARITFQYAAEPGKPTPGFVTLPAQKFGAKLPAGAQTATGAPLPVAKVTVAQSLDGDLKVMKAGGALTRTLEIFAERTQAMMIPPPKFAAPAGVRVYPKDPLLTDVSKEHVGFVGGRRVDKAVYVFEKPGDYILPEIDITWFNRANGKSEVARAAAIHIAVAANPELQPAIAPEAAPAAVQLAPAAKRIDWMHWLILLVGATVVLALVVWLALRYGARLAAWVKTMRVEYRESEARYFARVMQACKTNQASAARQALATWTGRIGAPSPTAWSAAYGTSALASEIAGLDQRLFGDGKSQASWNGRPLAALLAAARKTWLTRQAIVVRAPALPALNP
jgi:hypothetical protein